jgi:hypothetical protein
MATVGLSTSVTGLLVGIAGTVLPFLHTTNQYHSSIQDIGSIAVGDVGLIRLGISVFVTGVALSLSVNPD